MRQRLHKKRSGVFIFWMTIILFQLHAGNALAQTDSVYWDFGSTGSATEYASFSSNANVLANTCKSDTGNSGGTLAASTYSPGYLTNQFSSSGYTGATGEPTIRANCNTGSFNASTSSYISFTITPKTGYTVTIKAIYFAARRNGNFGPPSYSILTSADGYSSAIGTGSLSNGYGSSKESHTGLNIAGNANTPLTVRVYAYSGFLTSTGGSLFLDDVVIYYTVAAAGCSGTPTAGTATADTLNYCTSGSPVLATTGASKGSGITYQWYSSSTGTPASFSAVSSATDTSMNSSSLTDTTYFYCVTKCTNSGNSDTTNTVIVNVASPISASIAVSSTDTTICAGTPVTFNAKIPNNSSTVSISGAVLTSTQSMTSTSSCVGSGGKYANGWTSSGRYWQYKISTVGYEDIVFNTPTSSSGTGPHNGSLQYSTDGTNFTQVKNYSWSGTGCTSTGNVSLPSAADNQPTLYVRLYMTGASSSSGTNRVNPNAFKGKAMPANLNASYQWKKNGNNVGTDTNIYIDNNLSNNDFIYVELTPGVCASPATSISDTITMTVNPLLTPSVTTTVSPDDTICAGTSVTFTATPTNEGSSPAYQWMLNGTSVGSNNTSYTTTSLNNNDIVTCELTSSATCLVKTKDTSTAITMTVNPQLTPSVIISSTDTTICTGTSVTFTATPANEGSAPTYQWKLNGSNVGTNSTSYTNNSLSNNDVITCELTSNATCLTKSKDTSNGITMVVNSIVTPAVTTTVSPNDTICTGTSVTFTASPVNGGTSPSYQWKLNGSNVGTNSTAYTNSTLNNNDIITCELTSNAACLSKTKDTSTAIKMTVDPLLTPSVSTTVSPNDTVCAGTSVTFTATPANGGTTPSYQWKLNGSNVGTNSTSYTSSSLSNNDVITCELTSNATCLTKTKDTSADIKMTVNPLLTPSVSTTVSPNNTICAGTSVTFTATPANGGTTPSYQWKLNGSNVGTNSISYTSSSLSNNDVITCELTSNATCLTKTKDTSTDIKMTVTPLVTPSVIISSTDTTICAGTSVTFTATPTNGGTTPSYQWKLNGSNVGTNSSSYNNSSFSNNDVVNCVMTTNVTCPSQTTGTSNNIQMNVDPLLKPDIKISATPGNSICANSSVTFTSSVTYGGTSPSFQWLKNGAPVTGAVGNIWSIANLGQGDIVSCILTSSVTCASPVNDTSADITMSIKPTTIPKVSVTVNPGTAVPSGTTVTFNAIVSDAGTTPTYQWRKNGTDIIGETNSSYVTNTHKAKDTITVVVTSSDSCANPAAIESKPIIMMTSVNALYSNADNIKLYPNPNNGSFTLKGALATKGNIAATIEIINSVGAVVYKTNTDVSNYNEINAKVNITDIAQSGLYFVRITTGEEAYLLKLLVNQ